MCHVSAGSNYYAFKCRENVIEDVMPIGNVISSFHSPAGSQRDATLEFKSSARVLNDLKSSLLY